MTLTPHEKALIIDLRKYEGYLLREVSELTGFSQNTISKLCPVGKVFKADNTKLREKFLESGYSVSYVASKIGWYQRGFPDTSRVRRTLGINDDTSSVTMGGKRKKITSKRKMIDKETALLIAEAIGIDTSEVGIE